VTNLDDNGPGSLRDALTYTPAGGTVDFQAGLAGTITLTSGSLSIDHDLTVNGPGADKITVSGDHLFRVLNVFTGSYVAISDLTIANGQANSGSGLFNDGDLSLDRVVVTQNQLDSVSGAHGGGILNTGNLSLTDSTVSQNGAPMFSAGGDGAGIYNVGSLTALRTTITKNDAGINNGSGAGLFNLGSSGLVDCTISQNHGVLGGGGIDSEGGWVSLTNCAVTENHLEGLYSARGAGIRNTGSLVLTNTTVSQNGVYDTGDVYGVGIYNTGTLNLTGGSVSGNGTHNAISAGGGIYNLGTATLSDCSVTQNGAGRDGGGISTAGYMALTDCTVAYNSVQEQGHIAQTGGGISGYVTAVRTSIHHNYSDAWGGGVSGGGTFINCTISENTAYTGGGGAYGGETFINSTVTDNTVGPGYYDGNAGGGGLRVSGTVVMRNTIVARNKAEFDAGPDVMGTVTTATYNLIGDGSGSSGVVDGVDGNQVGNGNSPIDPKLGQLQDNGGPTWTEALLPGSPAIDAGNNGDAPDTDQRGFHRIVGGTVDIGAYEYQPPATLTLLQSDHNPSTAGQPVTFTAQVIGIASNSNTPPGLVTFFDDGNVLGTVALLDGTAALTTTDLTVGTHTIMVVYTGFTEGDYKFDASLSEPLNQEVLPGAGPFVLQSVAGNAVETISNAAPNGGLATSKTAPNGLEELVSQPVPAANAAAGQRLTGVGPDTVMMGFSDSEDKVDPFG
jgi:hypothetical protein